MLHNSHEILSDELARLCKVKLDEAARKTENPQSSGGDDDLLQLQLPQTTVNSKWQMKTLQTVANRSLLGDDVDNVVGGGSFDGGWGTSRWHDISFVSRHPWWEANTKREQERIVTAEAQLSHMPDVLSETIKDINSSVEYDIGSREPGVVSAITPGAIFWHLGLKRRLVGIERMALQGIFPDASLVSKFTQPFFERLAGNAFCMIDFAAVFLGAMTAIRNSHGYMLFPRVDDVDEAA